MAHQNGIFRASETKDRMAQVSHQSIVNSYGGVSSDKLRFTAEISRLELANISEMNCKMLPQCLQSPLDR